MKTLLGNFYKAIPISLMIMCSAAHAETSVAPNHAFGENTPEFLRSMNTAQPWKTWFVTPVLTHHFDRQAVIDDNLNENNPGFGIERSNGLWHWMLGAYRNSIRQTSVYAQLGWTPLQWHFSESGNLSLGAAGGLLTGYQNTEKGYPVVPAGGLFASLETPYHFGMNLFIVPTVKSFQVEGFVALQIKAHF
ncbi:MULTISPECIES: hypothetical protein [Deefgea]|uniref:Lipid A palmitoyltransferase PagP n=1 Tax=Deefgea chitinilytica TaxID=570276 RepID=A0ABS2CFE2_9NEIS|nr:MULTISPECIES: hypothetical protein [Deefgea]MBM5572852.1 hypothetical protein [Deefgea chitinilytica]MBM9890089.1 hypothetical protein [Deefgea sp. CFH1-16]